MASSTTDTFQWFETMDVIGYNEYPQRTETNITFDKNIPACFKL